jgi:hypothetical protein
MAHPLLWELPLPRGVGVSSGEIPRAVHIICGDSAGGSLKQAGARPLIVVPDELSVGPSHRDPAKHRRARHTFWREMYERVGLSKYAPDLLGAVLDAPALTRVLRDAGRERVMLWATGEWRGLLFLAWALDALRRANVNPTRVHHAGDLRAAWTLRCLNPESMRWVARRAQPLRAAARQAELKLWDAFTAEQPSALEAMRRAPPLALPTLPKAMSSFAALLPRSARGGTSRLRLSAVDESILGSLSRDAWRRFPDLVRTDVRTKWPFSGVFAMIGQYGDLFIQDRLARWTHGAAPAVEQMTVRQGPYPSAYRLSDRGAALLRRGFDDSAEMPEIAVGGYRSSARHSWLCHQRGTTWALQPL